MRDYMFRVSVKNRFGISDPSPYVVAHRSNFADDELANNLYLPAGEPFDLSMSTRYAARMHPFPVICSPSKKYKV